MSITSSFLEVFLLAELALQRFATEQGWHRTNRTVFTEIVVCIAAFP